MTNQLYIKTGGPIPEGSEFEIGKLYKAKLIGNKRHGIEFRHPNGKDEFASLCGTSAWLGHMSGFVLCDPTGNPVPAPWEGEQKCDCHLFDRQVCDICQGVDGTEVDAAPPINWQAHAEALAEALGALIDNAWASCEEEDGQLVGRATQEEWDAHCVATDAACAALAAFNQAKGV